MHEKRAKIINELKSKAEEFPVILSFSSPRIKTIKYFYIAGSDTSQTQATFNGQPVETSPFEPAFKESAIQGMSVPQASVPKYDNDPITEFDDVAALVDDEYDSINESVTHDFYNTSQNSNESNNQLLNEFPDFFEGFASEEELDEEDLDMSYKAQKKRLKEQKKEEKTFKKIQKDAHKRGYDTGLLYQLDSPEDLYDLKDEEIEQIQAAGIVNEDGFYSFVYPEDAHSFKREKTPASRILIVAILCAAFLGLLFILIRNIFNLF